MIKVTGLGTIEERLRRLEQSVNFSPMLMGIAAVHGDGGSAGSVTSVAGGVGITNDPEPIVGTGTVHLDINSLTAETTSASGDLLPFFDVSLASGTDRNDQRKMTRANLLGANVESLRGLTLAAGDVLYATGVGALTNLAAPASTGILRHDGTTPSWTTSTTVGHVLRMTAGGAAFGTIDLTDTDTTALGAANTVLNMNSAGTAWEADKLVAANAGSVTGTGDVFVMQGTPTLTTPILGTPTSGTLTNCTGLPISTGVSGLAANVATFLATPSSANLLAAVTDETGTGALVFGTAPTFTTNITCPLVIGGTGSGGVLQLQSTSHATKGTVDVLETIRLGVTAASYTATTRLITPWPNNVTLGAGISLFVISTDLTTFEMSGSPGILGFGNLFNFGGVLKNANAVATTGQAAVAFGFNLNFRSDGAAITQNDSFGVPAATGLLFQPVWSVINAGTGTHARAAAVYATSGALAAGWTVADLNAVYAPNPPAPSGTLTNHIVIEIANLTRATGINAGIRNASIEIDTPLVATIAAVGSTIGHTARCIRLNNTSGGALTLTSAPTITDGQDGERVLIFNGSANNVVIQDQGTLAGSNLRLSANTITLATRDSIELVYSSTVGDWIQVGQTNVL